MEARDSKECRNCHDFKTMDPEKQKDRSVVKHEGAMEDGKTCIECHKGIAHKPVRDKLTDAELEELEKPVKDYIRTIPPSYKEGLARATQREKDADAKRQAEVDDKVKAAVAVAEARAAAAAAQKAAADNPQATNAPAQPQPSTPATGQVAAAAGGVVADKIDWAGVPAKTIGFFYPGQASFEWVQNGREHGGARAFLRGGDRCVTCHDKEVRDMGAKIVSGEKAEPTPIPGKRGNVDVGVQVAYDADRLHFRFQWKNVAHVPVPFADGGKLDPTNQVKLAVTLAKAEGIERIDQAGCWTSCHSDARSMPDAPKADALKAGPAELGLTDGVRKYLADTRTEVDIKGDSGARGGWNKLKPAADIEALLKAGSFLDLMRFRSGGAPEHGYILADRIMEGGSPIEATGALDGETWTVTMSRALKAATDKELSIEPGQVYVLGIALHDDYANARFHHVSLALKFGLDVADVEIVATKK